MVTGVKRDRSPDSEKSGSKKQATAKAKSGQSGHVTSHSSTSLPTSQAGSSGNGAGQVSSAVNSDATAVSSVRRANGEADDSQRTASPAPSTSSGRSGTETELLLEAIQGVQRSINNLESSLADRLKCVVAEEMVNMREQVDDELKALKERICGLEDNVSEPGRVHVPAVQPDLNFVIRNLPEGSNENIVTKVNGLLKDGLRLRDVAVESADRKPSFRQGTPGVVVATCRTSEDHAAVFESKAKLGESPNFRHVGINRDKSKAERVYEANLRTLARTVGQGRLQVRGNRLVDARTDNNERQGNTPRGDRRERRDSEDPSTPNEPDRGLSPDNRPQRDNNNRHKRGRGGQGGRGGRGGRNVGGPREERK